MLSQKIKHHIVLNIYLHNLKFCIKWIQMDELRHTNCFIWYHCLFLQMHELVVKQMIVFLCSFRPNGYGLFNRTLYFMENFLLFKTFRFPYNFIQVSKVTDIRFFSNFSSICLQFCCSFLRIPEQKAKWAKILRKKDTNMTQS